jgi:hypothetical protein
MTDFLSNRQQMVEVNLSSSLPIFNGINGNTVLAALIAVNSKSQNISA